MSNESFYPVVEHGSEVLWAADPNLDRTQWIYGKVTVPKTNSCDIQVWTERGGMHRHDCWHADDPRIETSRAWAESGRGVFVLSPRELANRDRERRFDDLETKIRRLDASLEQAVLELSASTAPAKRRSKPTD